MSVLILVLIILFILLFTGPRYYRRQYPDYTGYSGDWLWIIVAIILLYVILHANGAI